jgi:hypothetical protein
VHRLASVVSGHQLLDHIAAYSDERFCRLAGCISSSHLPLISEIDPLLPPRGSGGGASVGAFLKKVALLSVLHKPIFATALLESKEAFFLPLIIKMTAVPAHLELLTFLSDPNAQVRQVALSSVIGYSAKNSPQRSLLTDKHKGLDGKPLIGRNGKEVDTIEDLKRLCQDQPVRK